MTHGKGVDNVLDEQNALELDESKVEQLLEILQDRLNGLLGDGVVLAGAKRAGEAIGQGNLAADLQRGHD